MRTDRRPAPATAPPSDVAVPALSALLGDGAAEVVSHALRARGARPGAAFTRRQVRYVPGRSVVVEFTVEIGVGSKTTRDILTIASGIDVPGRDAVPVAGVPYRWWWFPDDPFLPGLRAATDAVYRSELLERIGVDGPVGSARTRAYRATRRAVIEVQAGDRRVFCKVLRSGRAARLDERHRALESSGLVPPSLGFASTEGVVVIDQAPGQTLRQRLRERSWYDLGALDDVGASIADVASDGLGSVETAERRLRRVSKLLAVIHPTGAEVAERLLADGSLGGEPLDRPVHGDLHTGQLLVDPSSERITGLIDLDTFGFGDDLTDRASMLGQLVVLADLDGRYRLLRDGLHQRWSQQVEPERLAARTAVQVLALATGPFRTQEANWPAKTARRVGLAAEVARGGGLV